MRAWEWASALIVGGMMAMGVANASPAGEITILTWADYLAPAVLAKFEKETGVKVTLDTFESIRDMRAKMTANPGRYDIINPADYEIPSLAKRGMLEPLDAQHLPGYANLLDGWRSPPYDQKNEWSVPLHWGTTSIVVDTNLYKGEIDTIKLLFDPPPELKDKIGFLIGAEETLRLALIWMGQPQCTSDRALLDRAMAFIRPMLHKDRIYTIANAIDTLAGPDIAVGIAWNGDALRAREKKPSLRYAYLKEGLIIWSDTLALPKGARNKAAALRFIDFLLQPENAALQSNFTRYANAIRGSDAFMDQALLDAPEIIVPSHIRVRFFRSCDSEQMSIYSDVWDTVLQDMAK